MHISTPIIHEVERSPNSHWPWEASVANWRQLYTAALLNTNPNVFEPVVDEASRAMNLRSAELRSGRWAWQELHEIALAAKSLVVMRAAWQESKLGRRSQILIPSSERYRWPRA
jgi:hypothetical protein